MSRRTWFYLVFVARAKREFPNLLPAFVGEELERYDPMIHYHVARSLGRS